MIKFKTYSKSFKNKRRYDNDPENWMVFKDVHEPIIARADFEKVQERIAKAKRRAPKPQNGKKSIFADLLFCGDCIRTCGIILTRSIRKFTISCVPITRWTTVGAAPDGIMCGRTLLNRL